MNQILVPIPGLQLIPNAITPEHHDHLVTIVDQQPWLTDLRRRVQHYGYRYDYKSRSVDASQFLGPLPDWSLPFLEQLQHAGLIEQVPDQLIVNEYQPGQGISPHIDCRPCFGDAIFSLTLGSSCIMEFTHAEEKTTMFLEPGSVLLMRGEARQIWKHSIPARKRDQYAGQSFERKRRISLTFRNVVLQSPPPR
jgi:alkylated DNA repair dioxygenase AlkB